MISCRDIYIQTEKKGVEGEREKKRCAPYDVSLPLWKKHSICGRNTACNLSVCWDNTHARAERVSFLLLQHTHTQAERMQERECKRKREKRKSLTVKFLVIIEVVNKESSKYDPGNLAVRRTIVALPLQVCTHELRSWGKTHLYELPSHKYPLSSERLPGCPDVPRPRRTLLDFLSWTPWKPSEHLAQREVWESTCEAIAPLMRLISQGILNLTANVSEDPG